jgi:hypothetical protein
MRRTPANPSLAALTAAIISIATSAPTWANPKRETTRVETTSASKASGGDDDLVDAEETPWSQGCTSAVSSLTIGASGEARHEHDTLQAHLKLRAADGKEHNHDLGGQVGCLAYSQTSHRYILGAIGEVGAWRPLLEIYYLDENTGALVASKAIPTLTHDKQAWCAFAAVASQDGRFIALVSDYDFQIKLEALDTREDRLIRLGKPPLPPPSAWARENVTSRADFNWGSAEAGADGFIAMDRGSLVWRGHALEASYGKDGPSRRAKTRTTKRWDLDKLAAKRSGG